MDQVTVAALRNFATALLDHLEEVHGSSVPIGAGGDSFWWVPAEKAYDMTSRPRSEDLTIGLLSECAEQLTSMIRDDAALIWGLVWFGQLLAGIGQQTDETDREG